MRIYCPFPVSSVVLSEFRGWEPSPLRIAQEDLGDEPESKRRTLRMVIDQPEKMFHPIGAFLRDSEIAPDQREVGFEIVGRAGKHPLSSGVRRPVNEFAPCQRDHIGGQAWGGRLLALEWHQE